MNRFEELCRTWLKGCSNAISLDPKECPECTTAFLEAVQRAAESGDICRCSNEREEAKVLIGDLHSSVKKKEIRIEELTMENEAAVRLIWCMVKTMGGEIRIPDSVMVTCTPDCRLESYYDIEQSQTVFNSARTGKVVKIQSGEKEPEFPDVDRKFFSTIEIAPNLKKPQIISG